MRMTVVLVLCVGLSVLATPVKQEEQKHSMWDVMNGHLDNTEKHSAPATNREPPKAVQASNIVISPYNQREFFFEPSKNCKNRAYIMTTYLHRIAQAECQRKCAIDKECSGYSVFRSEHTTDEGECTIFKGACEKTADAGHDLFISAPGRPMTVAAPVPATAAAPAVMPDASKSVQPTTNSDSDSSMLNMTIVIPTVRRFQTSGDLAPERYLGPLVTKLLQDLNPAQRSYVKFIILNSDKEPEKHEEALELANLPNVQVLTKPNWDQELDRQLELSGSLHSDGRVYLEDGREVNKEWIKWVAAEDFDGSYLLELASRQSPYVLFLEDDVYPTAKALEKLTKFVRNLKVNDWLFADLYTPNLDWAEGMLDVKNGQRYNFQCCTQAMLFRSDMLPGIISYWRSHPAEPVDDNLRHYREKITPDFFIYAARPNLFQHVGAYSSNPQKSTGHVEHESIEFSPLLFQTDAATTSNRTVLV